MSITENCMIANMSIGVWLGNRLDKAASQALNDEANAEADVARVNKFLVPRTALRPVQQAATQLRTFFYDRTLPWKDNGDRVLLRRGFDTFIRETERLKAAFDCAVGTFLGTTYPEELERAQFRMGKLWNPDDYPMADQLARKFYARLDLDAVTEAKDFRVKLANEHVEAIQQQIERAMEERIQRAMADVWGRVVQALTHYANKMSNEDEIFKDSTVNNLMEIAALIPALNLTNDAVLESVRIKIEQALGNIEPKDLRKHSDVREAAAKDAFAILSEMSPYVVTV